MPQMQAERHRGNGRGGVVHPRATYISQSDHLIHTHVVLQEILENIKAVDLLFDNPEL